MGSGYLFWAAKISLLHQNEYNHFSAWFDVATAREEVYHSDMALAFVALFDA